MILGDHFGANGTSMYTHPAQSLMIMAEITKILGNNFYRLGKSPTSV